jgi:hypothetical protein
MAKKIVVNYIAGPQGTKPFTHEGEDLTVEIKDGALVVEDSGEFKAAYSPQSWMGAQVAE